MNTLTNDEKTIGMLCHLTGLISIIGPIIVWLLKKDDSAFVDANGKQAINFQLSIIIYSIGSAFLLIIGIGLVLLFAIGIFAFIMIVIASIKAANGEVFQYPLSIQLLK
ncbi:MAG: DUF4870 domain-containing protein [Chlorobi bacterium]|nr:DUF4870 domain-containing protein [Chlorobiota bacterium]